MPGTSKRAVAVAFVAGAVVGVVGTVFIVHHVPVHTRQESKAVRDTRVLAMTPKQFVTRCGKLISDDLICEDRFGFDVPCPKRHGPPEARKVTVRMTLPTGQKKAVTAMFDNKAPKGKKPDWELQQVGQYLAYRGTFGGLDEIEELYPCTTKP